MELVWRHDPPDRPGWYFCRLEADPNSWQCGAVSIDVVFVDRVADGLCTFWYDRDGEKVPNVLPPIDPRVCWAGPIPLPEDPWV